MDSPTVPYGSVSRWPASRGASSPTVGRAQPDIVARAPAAVAPPAAVVSQGPDADEAAPDEGLDPTATPVRSLAVPGGVTGFTAIPASRSSDARATPTTETSAQVRAPAANSFVGIDATPGSRVSVPSSSGILPIP